MSHTPYTLLNQHIEKGLDAIQNQVINNIVNFIWMWDRKPY